MSIYRSNDTTNSVKALNEDRTLRIRLQSHQIHPTMLQWYKTYAVCKENTKYTDKHTQTHTWT